MEQSEFELEYKGGKIKVSRTSLANPPVFRIVMPGKDQPLFITRALDANKERFWTSVPEGNLQIAEEIGTLIEKHFKSQQS